LFGFKKQIASHTAGYGDNMIQSLGLIFLAIFLVLIVVVGLYLTNKMLKNNEKVKKLKEFIYSKLFFNAIIRVFI